MAETSEHNEKIIDQHTRQAAGYARLTGSIAGQKRIARHEMIGAQPDDVVLDIACGPGSLTLQLAPHVLRATGLDLTPAMLEQAREAQARSGVSNVAWVLGDGADLPFASESFTLVTCSAAFHHFDDPSVILGEMARVCRAGGRIVVSDVTPDAGKTAAYDRMEKLRDPSHGHAHSLPELVALGQRLDLGEPATQSTLTGPMPYEAVLATSFPEQCRREDLLELMRQDAETGDDALGFRAQLSNEGVQVTYPMSTLIWTRH